jgi:peroxiredoxin
MRRRLVRAASVLLAVVLAGGLAACSGDSLADQYKSGDNKGYVAGDFAVKEISANDRGEPVVFSGTLDDGSTVSNKDYTGKVLVVNFWYAGCGPCRLEAKQLEDSYQSFAGKDVAFLGVNTYDQAATAQSFAATYKVTYPSVIDVNSGSVTLAFAAAKPLNATPVTLVLDPQGRVAARIVGPVPQSSILNSLIDDALSGTS